MDNAGAAVGTKTARLGFPSLERASAFLTAARRAAALYLQGE
jgi:hypothetical protein